MKPKLIENPARIPFRDVGIRIAAFRSWDSLAAAIQDKFPHWFIYRGGNHIAIHRKSGDAERMALIVDSTATVTPAVPGFYPEPEPGWSDHITIQEGMGL